MKTFRPILFVIILIFMGSLHAKGVSLRGIIKDAKNHSPLAYVNIGIANTVMGTITAPDGSFTLPLNDIESPLKINISHIGYEQKCLVIKNLNPSELVEILLQPHAVSLETVEVNAAKLFSKTVGCKKTRTRMVVFFTSDEYGNQQLGTSIGRRFKIKKKAYLDTLGFFIKLNNFDTVRFSVNIHEIEKGRPGKILNDKHILTEIINRKKGWVKIDLSPYKLSFKQDVIACVEWVYRSKKGNQLALPIAMPILGSTHYRRPSSQGEWKRFRAMSSAMYLKFRTE